MAWEGKRLKHDEVLNAKLQEASKNIPGYLFRMWHPGSGGNSKLNTTDSVTPHAFLHRPDHDLPVVYDMTAEQFIDNTTKHLCGDRTVLSEFSSWSASPRFVLHYATTQRDSAYVAVIDTAKFQKGIANATFHVPALKPIFGSHKSCQAFNGGRGFDHGKYDWEYLVHGVIKGRHYKAVSFRTLCQQGLIDHLPALRDPVNVWCTERWLLPGPSLLFDAREFSQLQKIAKLFGFGSRFHTVLTITLFCCKKRHFQGASIPRNDRYHVSRTLGNRDDIPYDWSDSHFLQDEVYDARYEENRQMVNVIKLVHTHCSGTRFQPMKIFETGLYKANSQHAHISSEVSRSAGPFDNVYHVPFSIIPSPLSNMFHLWRFPGISKHTDSHIKAVRSCPKDSIIYVAGPDIQKIIRPN